MKVEFDWFSARGEEGKYNGDDVDDENDDDHDDDEVDAHDDED